MGGHLSDGGWLTQVAHQVTHALDHSSAPLSEGGAVAVVVQVVPGKPALEADRHGFPESSAVKRSAAPAPRVPASHGASWRRTGGGGSGGSDPLIFAAGAPRAGGKVARPLATLPPLVFGVAPSTVIPGGKASSASSSSGTSTSAPGCAPSSMKPSKNRRPQMARGREGQGWRMLTTRYLRSEPTGSLPPGSTVSEAESRGLQHRKTCPPTS